MGQTATDHCITITTANINKCRVTGYFSSNFTARLPLGVYILNVMNQYDSADYPQNNSELFCSALILAAQAIAQRARLMLKPY
jgi:hypothetical protein